MFFSNNKKTAKNDSRAVWHALFRGVLACILLLTVCSECQASVSDSLKKALGEASSLQDLQKREWLVSHIELIKEALIRHCPSDMTEEDQDVLATNLVHHLVIYVNANEVNEGDFIAFLDKTIPLLLSSLSPPVAPPVTAAYQLVPVQAGAQGGMVVDYPPYDPVPSMPEPYVVMPAVEWEQAVASLQSMQMQLVSAQSDAHAVWLHNSEVWNQLNTERSQSSRRQKQLNRKLQDNDQALNEAKKVSEKLRRELDEEKQAKNLSREKINEKEQQLAVNQDKVKGLSQTQVQLENEKAELERDKQALEARVGEVEKQLAEARQKEEELKNQLAKDKEAEENAQKDRVAAERAQKAAEKDKKASRKNKKIAYKVGQEAVKTLQKSEFMVRSAEDEKKKLEERSRELQEEKEALEKQKEALKAKVDQHKEEKEAAIKQKMQERAENRGSLHQKKRIHIDLKNQKHILQNELRNRVIKPPLYKDNPAGLRQRNPDITQGEKPENVTPNQERNPAGAAAGAAVNAANGAERVGPALRKRFSAFPVATTLIVLAATGIVITGVIMKWGDALLDALNSIVPGSKGQTSEPIVLNATGHSTNLLEEASSVVADADNEHHAEEPASYSDPEPNPDTVLSTVSEAPLGGRSVSENKCLSIESEKIQTFCKALDEKQQQIAALIWQLKNHLVLTEFQPFILKSQNIFQLESGLPEELSKKERGSVIRGVVATELKRLRELPPEELLGFISGVVKEGLPSASRSEQIRTLLVYARLCGSGMEELYQSCFKRVTALIEKEGLQAISNELGALPAANQLSITRTLKKDENKLAVLPVWLFDHSMTLARKPDFVPLIYHPDGYSIPHNPEQSVSFSFSNWLIPESGNYQLQAFRVKSSASPFSWSNNQAEHFEAGVKPTLKIQSGMVFRLSHKDLPLAKVGYTDEQSAYVQPWNIDYRMNGAVNFLLLAMKQAEESLPLPDSLQQWLLQCRERPEQCQFFHSNLHYGVQEILEDKIKNYFKVRLPLFKPTQYMQSTPIQIANIGKAELEQWLQLFSYALTVSNVAEEAFPNLADDARKFCGLFPPPYGKRHLFSCFIYLAEQYANAPDLNHVWNNEFQNYLQGFPDADNADQNGLVLSIIWPVYGKDNLGHPRFLPAIKLNNRYLLLVESKQFQSITTDLRGDYEVFRLDPDSMIEPLGIVTFDGQISYSFQSGHYILIRKNNPEERVYSILHPSSFYKTPRPLFPTTYQFLPEDEYGNKDGELHPVNCDEQPEGREHFDNIRDACLKLAQRGALDAQQLLMKTYHRFYNKLEIPHFMLMDYFEHPYKITRDDPLGHDSHIQRRLDEIRQYPEQPDQNPIRLLPFMMESIYRISAVEMAHLAEEYTRLMTEEGITKHRDFMMYMLLTHCGKLTGSLRNQCAKRMFQFIISSPPAKKQMTAYLNSIGLEARDRAIEMVKSDRGTTQTTLLVNWYLDKKLQLTEPSYRFITQQGNSISEVTLTGTFNDFSQKLVELKHLKPGAAYHIWAFDVSTGRWIDDIVSPPYFQVPQSKSSMSLLLDYDKFYGIAPQGSTGPESFFYIWNDHRDAFGQDHPVPMPPPLWPQTIEAAPVYNGQ